MAACGQGSAQLGVHLLGALDPADADEVELHLAECQQCRAEFAELAVLRTALDEVPAEAFLDGPPDGGDLLLQRTVRQVRQERATERRNHWMLGAAAAVVAIAALVVAGAVVGRNTGDEVTALPSPSATVPLPPAGTRTVQATDPVTKVRITARVEPAAGWVRVHAAVTGIQAGQRCRLVVVGADGTRETAGSWLVSPVGEQQGTTLDGAALVRPQDVRAVVVENFDGQQFVSASV